MAISTVNRRCKCIPFLLALASLAVFTDATPSSVVLRQPSSDICPTEKLRFNCQCHVKVTHPGAPTIRILFIGDGLTSHGRIPVEYPSKFKHIMESKYFVNVMAVTANADGKSFWKHLGLALDTEDPSCITKTLNNPSLAGKFDYVVMHDLSVTPGKFKTQDPTFDASLEALREILELPVAKSAKLVLLSTWGWRFDLPDEPIYPDFLTMNDLITQGYTIYAKKTKETTGVPVYVAPGGAGILSAYQENSTLFNLAYADHKHPSHDGDYFLAGIVASTITGLPMSGALWSVSEFSSAYLEISDRVVLQGHNLRDKFFPPWPMHLNAIKHARHSVQL